MVADYCNLTADVAVPTLNLGACHQDRFSFSLYYFGNLQAISLHPIMSFFVLASEPNA